MVCVYLCVSSSYSKYFIPVNQEATKNQNNRKTFKKEQAAETTAYLEIRRIIWNSVPRTLRVRLIFEWPAERLIE